MRSAPSFDNMLTAIQIGADSVLLRTRAAILETAGLRVQNVEGFSFAMKAILTGSFDLAILCHSLHRDQRLNLTAAIRRNHPAALILLVSRGPGAGEGEREGIDAVLESHPRQLLEDLRGALQLRNARQSAIAWRVAAGVRPVRPEEG